MDSKTDAVVTITEPDGSERQHRIELPLGDPDRLLCVLLDEYAARGQPRFADEATDNEKEAA
jgi:hypothetical protein